MKLAWRHIRHPIASAGRLLNRAERSAQAARSRWETRRVRRFERKECWCGGKLEAFDLHPSFGVCPVCRCYVNTQPPLPSELKKIYGFKRYWHRFQSCRGHASIDERAMADVRDGRVESWLEFIDSFAPSAKDVIEVGCGSGVLLEALAARGCKCLGIEPDPKTAEWVTARTGIPVVSGFFPDVTGLPDCDLLMAFDVLEHVFDPAAFVARISELLHPNGIAIIQTPIDHGEFDVPFGNRFQDAFDDVAHLVLFSDEGMNQLAAQANMTVVSLDHRLAVHHEICVLRAAG